MTVLPVWESVKRLLFMREKTMRHQLSCVVLLCLATPTVAGSPFPKFRTLEIDPQVGNVCYAVTLADVNGDDAQDIVAVTENAVVWYENPSWRKRTIIEDQTERDNVCIAPYDIDGDGQVDFALGAGWTKVGTIQWLARGKSLDEKWQVYPIGQERWLHRMRWADVQGKGRKQLVISPLNKTVADGVRLLAFEIPKNPKSDSWPTVLLDGSLNRMHNHWHLDFDGDGTEDTVTASQEGIHLIRRSDGQKWTKTKLGTGFPAARPGQGGAGEIKVGKLSKDRQYIATVEPMHGNQVAVYTPAASESELWQRHVLENGLKQGHAVWVADLDRDGADELIIGHREKGTGPVAGPGVYVYDAQDPNAKSWKKHVLDDGGMATEDLIAADLNGDGWIDIVAGGRATHNVKLYQNLGIKK